MKFVAMTILAGVMLLLPGASTVPVFAQEHDHHASGREQFSVMFPELVRLQGTLLKGSYIIVHDEERMARGEDCLYVYTNAKGKPGRLVASYKCEPVERAKTEDFKVVLARVNLFLVPEVREIQFPGSTKGHRVPS